MKEDLRMREEEEKTHKKGSSRKEFCDEDSDSERGIGKCESRRTGYGKAIEDTGASNSGCEDENNSEEEKKVP